VYFFEGRPTVCANYKIWGGHKGREMGSPVELGWRGGGGELIGTDTQGETKNCKKTSKEKPPKRGKKWSKEFERKDHGGRGRKTHKFL